MPKSCSYSHLAQGGELGFYRDFAQRLIRISPPLTTSIHPLNVHSFNGNDCKTCWPGLSLGFKSLAGKGQLAEKL